jgi:hypothetical protein
MRKIHPGFIALAVVLGPATLIRGHQVVSDYLSQRPAQNSDATELAQHVYQKCSTPPTLQRSVQCNEYVNWYDGCVSSRNTCDLQSVYTRLNDLELIPTTLKSMPDGNVALTSASKS